MEMIYRANCKCGWQSSWCSNQDFAARHGNMHRIENDQSLDHLTFVSWGEYSDLIPAIKGDE